MIHLQMANLSFRLGSTMTNLPLPDDTFDGSFPVSVGFLLKITIDGKMKQRGQR